MIKVIIADDEARICKLIENLVHWEAFGMEIAGLAHNGIDCLRLIETEKPQLVITDIRIARAFCELAGLKIDIL